jgi:proteasome activator subunit 4
MKAAKSIWNGLPTFYQEPVTEVDNPCVDNEVELPELLPVQCDVDVGFTLRDTEDPRYEKVNKARTRFGKVTCRAASVLHENTGGEDHIDAIFGVVRSIEAYLLEYGVSRSSFASLQKNYMQAKRYAVAAQQIPYSNNGTVTTSCGHDSGKYLGSFS